jgi:wobble nucleotide-excising tRNase
VTLQFPGKQGQVTRKKLVADGEHRPSDVLSEGEQKVIALADFLAEASLKPAAPVIFDDPINSLDYRRMAEVKESAQHVAGSILTESLNSMPLWQSFDMAILRVALYASPYLSII